MNAKDYTDDDDFPKGPGDPDAYGYPGSDDFHPPEPTDKHEWVHIQSEAEAMRMPIVTDDGEVDIY